MLPARPTPLLRPLTALLAVLGLTSPAWSHERWVAHELLSPFDRDLFESAGPTNLGLLAVALVVLAIAGVLGRRVADPRPSEAPATTLRDAALAFLGLTYGVGCMISAMNGEFLAPDLVADQGALARGLVWGSGATGLLLALGLFTRPAAWASLALFVLAVAVRPFEYFDDAPVGVAAVLNYLDVVGITLFLALAGRGSMSLDRLLGRQRTSEGTAGRARATGLLRLFLGATLLLLGLQKFLHPELPMGVVQNYGDAIYEPFEQLLGVSEELYVFGAALVEFSVGLVLLMGVFTRLVMLVLAGMFTATLFVFEGEIFGHLPLFGIVVLLFAEGGGSFRLPPRKPANPDGSSGFGLPGGLANGAACLLALASLLISCGGQASALPEVETSATGAAAHAEGLLGRYDFELTFTEPSLGELFGAQTVVRDAETGALVSGGNLAVDCTMPSHGHGMMTSPQTNLAAPTEGRFATAGMKLHMHGAWEFQLDFELEGRRDAASIAYEYEPQR